MDPSIPISPYFVCCASTSAIFVVFIPMNLQYLLNYSNSSASILYALLFQCWRCQFATNIPLLYPYLHIHLHHNVLNSFCQNCFFAFPPLPFPSLHHCLHNIFSVPFGFRHCRYGPHSTTVAIIYFLCIHHLDIPLLISMNCPCLCHYCQWCLCCCRDDAYD